VAASSVGARPVAAWSGKRVNETHVDPVDIHLQQQSKSLDATAITEVPALQAVDHEAERIKPQANRRRLPVSIWMDKKEERCGLLSTVNWHMDRRIRRTRTSCISFTTGVRRGYSIRVNLPLSRAGVGMSNYATYWLASLGPQCIL